MILDAVTSFERYLPLHPAFKKVADYLRTTSLDALPLGRHAIDGDAIYVNVETYVTQMEKKIEAHRRYLDIQMVLSGRENMGWVPLSQTQEYIPYNTEKDILFVRGTTTLLQATPEVFLIFFPEDAHQPGLQIQEPLAVKKAVFKILL